MLAVGRFLRLRRSCVQWFDSMQDFRELRVWQRGRELTVEIYRTTAALPDDERYGLSSQMRRAAISIIANIAEGCGRDTAADFARFLQIAVGSASELASHLIIAGDLRLIASATQRELLEELSEIKRMLTVLTQRVRQSASEASNH